MPDQLVIKGLEFQAHIGITPEERDELQPIAVDLEVDYPDDALAMAISTDDIAHAVDYNTIVARVSEVGTSRTFSLVETLADRLAEVLLREFPVRAVSLWVRKLSPPIHGVLGSIGIHLNRQRSAPTGATVPPLLQFFKAGGAARFLTEQVHRLPKGTVLDVAAGRGRNALYLAAQGYTVEAIDWDEQALAAIEGAAAEHQMTNISVHAIDLEAHPTLAKERYETVIVFFYLQRTLFPALLGALKPGGILMYETFLIDNHLRRMHPRRREFCLDHNELLGLTGGMRVLYYEEGEQEGGHGAESAYTARLIARKE